MLISIAAYPVRTEALLIKHIESGALLVQHKDSLDVITSLGERLDDSLARMCSIAFRQYQRVLLTIGLFAEHRGEVCVNGHDTGVKWIQYQGAMSKWGKRGGCIENVDKAALIPAWCELQLKHLQEMRDKPLKPVYQRGRMPDGAAMVDDPLQLCIPVRDARNTLISIPGVGPELAEWLWRVTGGNLGYALTLLTHPEAATLHDDKPRNLGPALIGKCRAYFGIERETDYITQIEYDVIGEKSNE